jgi:ectoine hydroxylase-related dioxygenase (phytanoyl-CoA dioxygenase family)
MHDNKRIVKSEDIEFFNENGYWISPKLFDDKQLASFLERMERLYHGEYETGIAPNGLHWKYGDDVTKLRKSDNVHVSDLVMNELATDPKLGEIAASFLNADQIMLFFTQMLYKPPASNSVPKTANVGWHQDLQYWQFAEQPTLLTAWVAFNDVTIDNGCMHFVPGSHKWGLLKTGDFWDQDITKQEQAIKDKFGEFKKVPIQLKAGQVSFHHALTYHGSGPNTSEGPRCSIAIHMMSGKTKLKPGREQWEQTSNLYRYFHKSFAKLQEGDYAAGEDFPVIYEKARS